MFYRVCLFVLVSSPLIPSLPATHRPSPSLDTATWNLSSVPPSSALLSFSVSDCLHTRVSSHLLARRPPLVASQPLIAAARYCKPRSAMSLSSVCSSVGCFTTISLSLYLFVLLGYITISIFVILVLSLSPSFSLGLSSCPFQSPVC